MAKKEVILSRSSKPDKKYQVKVDNKTIHFGQAGASDYTKHKDPERKNRYVTRHKAREDWARSGLDTAGFWSKHLLWNKPSITQSINAIESRFNIDIKRR